MHFDALLGLVIPGLVLKNLQIEIGAKLAIDSGKQIQIEGGCKAERVS